MDVSRRARFGGVKVQQTRHMDVAQAVLNNASKL
jgi:hypothetical protein